MDAQEKFWQVPPYLRGRPKGTQALLIAQAASQQSALWPPPHKKAKARTVKMGLILPLGVGAVGQGPQVRRERGRTQDETMPWDFL